MYLSSIRWLIITVVLLLFAFSAHAEVAVPPLKSHVTDLTGTLTPQQINELEATLMNFEKASGSQIAVLIVPTTKPEEIEQYSIRVVDQWKLGRKKIDDGILLLIAKDDHKVRIEVGYGLEGAVPDAIAKRIIEEVIIPSFKNGDYSGGINAGVNTLIKVISGEPLPAPKETGTNKITGSSDLWVYIFFIAAAIGIFFQKIFGKLLGSLIVSVLVGLVAWFFIDIIIAAVIIGIIAFFLMLWIGSDGGKYGGGGWGGGWGGGSGGGSSWGGGGGGGFGGGGSSGSW